MPKGFLVVLSEPGQVSLEEFHDWYNNEHIPLRLNHLSAFLTGARYTASDGKKPSWIALYDVDSTSTFSDPAYTRLRENRSPREAALVKRLDVLDRRTCEVVFEDENQGSRNEKSNTGLAVGNPTKWIFTYGIDINAQEDKGTGEVVAEAWRSITEAGTTVKGLHRSRLLRCIDNLKTGVTITPDFEEQKVPRYFVLHELDSEDDLAEVRAVLGRLAGNKLFVISESREWTLYRAYPCIAQGNLGLS